MMNNSRQRWCRYWMRRAGLNPIGRLATWLATFPVAPYYGRCFLAGLNKNGYISPKATIYHNHLQLGKHTFIGDDVVIYDHNNGGPVEIGERVHIFRSTFIQTGKGGSVKIGADTIIHPRCQISAYKSSVIFGKNIQVAPNCAFYPYNYGTNKNIRMDLQPLSSKGPIIVDDEAWLGYGVIVLDGVHIGKGAVIGAGSVVTKEVPEASIAAGNPAKVIKLRQ